MAKLPRVWVYDQIESPATFPLNTHPKRELKILERGRRNVTVQTSQERTNKTLYATKNNKSANNGRADTFWVGGSSIWKTAWPQILKKRTQ